METISWWRSTYDQNEIGSVTEAINNEYVSMGPNSSKLEEMVSNTLDVPYVLATTSGSMALYMSLLSINIKNGDEVIVPDLSFIATAHAPKMLGARVVLADVRNDLPLIDIDDLRKKISSKTKAIIPVHLNGRDAGMTEIMSLANQFGIPVIEDACQAFASRNNGSYLGAEGDIGCFSLGITKLVSSGFGGLVVTKNRELYRKLKLIRTHGIEDMSNRAYSMLGFNFKFSDILASIGIVQLKKLEKKIQHVKKIYQKYESELKNSTVVDIVPVAIEKGEIPLYVEAICRNRKELMKFLSSKNINVQKFNPSLHLAEYFECNGSFVNSKKFSESLIILPCGPSQPLENIDFTISAIKEFE